MKTTLRLFWRHCCWPARASGPAAFPGGSVMDMAGSFYRLGKPPDFRRRLFAGNDRSDNATRLETIGGFTGAMIAECSSVRRR